MKLMLRAAAAAQGCTDSGACMHALARPLLLLLLQAAAQPSSSGFALWWPRP
jgi:hypothetical protein